MDLAVSSDPQRLDLPRVHAWIAASYWARGIPYATFERAVTGSLCFGAYARDTQVGFARVVSDRATFAWLCDVFVAPSHRGQGVAKMLCEAVLDHPELRGLRRMLLGTLDAHGLYARYGFAPLPEPERYMTRMLPYPYPR